MLTLSTLDNAASTSIQLCLGHVDLELLMHIPRSSQAQPYGSYVSFYLFLQKFSTDYHSGWANLSPNYYWMPFAYILKCNCYLNDNHSEWLGQMESPGFFFFYVKVPNV